MTVRHRLATYWALPALAVAASLGGAPVLGQTQDRSFWSRPTGAEQRAPDQRNADQRPEEASRLYADARIDLENGQYALAQRKLELLVARHPTSPLADVARRDLQRLYAGTLGAPSPQQSPSAVPAARTIQMPEQGRTQSAPVAVLPIQQPNTVQAPIQEASDDFRHLAGDRIFFADSSTDLGGRAKSALESQAAWLIRYPGIDVIVEGHSDDHGGREFNRALAEKRAYAVKLRLNDLGVSADRISMVVYGRERPVADCPEPHCSAQNRRVVTTITRVPPGMTFNITRNSDRNSGVPVR